MGKPENNTGLLRLIRAAHFSWAGLKAAFRYEAAFRQEMLLILILVPLAIYLGDNGVERALLIVVCLLVPIVELLNSAVEAVVDRVGLEHHELAGRAKDIGSAAVMVSLMLTALVWGLILIPHLTST